MLWEVKVAGMIQTMVYRNMELATYRLPNRASCHRRESFVLSQRVGLFISSILKYKISYLFLFFLRSYDVGYIANSAPMMTQLLLEVYIANTYASKVSSFTFTTTMALCTKE